MNNPFLNLVRITWQYAGRKRIQMVITYTMFVIANIIDMAQPLLLGWLLNTIQQGGQNLFPRILAILCLYYSVPFFFWIFHGTARILERQLSFAVVQNFKERLFEMVTRLPLSWHKSHHSGNTIDRIKKATDALTDFTEETFVGIGIIMRLLIALVAICIFSAFMGLSALVICALIVYVIITFDKHLLAGRKRVNELDHHIASALHDYITNIVTVISLRIEKLSRAALSQRIMGKFSTYRHLVRLNEVKWFTVSMMLSVMSFSIVALYLYRTIADGGVILIGMVTMLYQYVDRLNFAFFDFAWQYEQIVKRNIDIKTIDELASDFHQHDRQSSVPLVEKWNRIEIRHLDFTHDGQNGEREHLRDVHLELHRGRKIALVGESGSGKSTLMVMLRGLLDTDAVELMVDGNRYPSFRSLAALSTLIPQDPEIFDHTIEYNITAGVAHREEDVRIAAELACFDQVAERLPSGYQSHINEKGVNLSGGEKQRLALARGIFAAHASSILLLDEPTSSVDTINELRIYQNLFKHFAGRCIVSSIHKLHLLSMFDWIYVLERGMVRQEGTLTDLLQQGGGFREMWDRYQTSGRDDENTQSGN